MEQLPIALTAGEPSGIGPDLCALLSTYSPSIPAAVVADRGMLLQRALQLGISLTISEYTETSQPSCGEGRLTVIHHPLRETAIPGRLAPANSPYVLETLDIAIQGCLEKKFVAMVTAPVHKGVINDAGIPFTGHTEYLADRTRTPCVVMMLAGGGMRVAVATTHLPLSSVPAAITREHLERILRVLNKGLVDYLVAAPPQIFVAGLNPHAGESGHLGREEIDVIEPVLNQLRLEGMQLTGPLPADTLFTPDKLAQCDCVLAMYHDQGLPVLKHASFGGGVNVTLGLPFIRTSVDHGTALDLAGTGRIDTGSLKAAIDLAMNMARHGKA